MKKKMTVLSVIIAVIAVSMSGCSGGDRSTIRVGSKQFTENIMVGEMLALLVENNTDLEVERKLNMGGTLVNFEACKNGEIDTYLEYTGTGMNAELKIDIIQDPDEGYRVVKEEFEKQFGITWMDPIGLNNTFVLAVSEDVYNKYKVETCSDLVAISNELVFGAEHEFFGDREDGYEFLVKAYNYNFKDAKQLETVLRYQAIGRGDIDVVDAFATDGQIKQYNLHVLQDDKNFFPPYYAAPVVNMKTLEKHPELAEVLNMLSGLLDDETMVDLNYQVDVEKKDYEDVAKQFLLDKGLIKQQ